MKPTLYFRYVERTDMVAVSPDGLVTTTRTVPVLQQFWECDGGKEHAGDTFTLLAGVWRDVPTVRA